MLGILFLFLSILLADTPFLMAIIIISFIILSFLLKDFNAIETSMLTIVMYMFYYLHPFLLIIVKILLLYILYLISKNLVTFNDKKHLFNMFFYRLNNSKTNKLYVINTYKKPLFINNINIFNHIDKLTRRKYSNYIVNEALKKTNYDLEELNYRNTLSYYGYYKKRGSNLDMQWNNIDNTFLLIHVLIFILVIIY